MIAYRVLGPDMSKCEVSQETCWFNEMNNSSSDTDLRNRNASASEVAIAEVQAEVQGV